MKLPVILLYVSYIVSEWDLSLRLRVTERTDRKIMFEKKTPWKIRSSYKISPKGSFFSADRENSLSYGRTLFFLS